MRHRRTKQAVSAAVATIVLLIAGLGVLPGRAGADAAADERVFLQLINDLRTGKGLHPLTVDPELAAGATAWSATMAAEDRLSHSPDMAAGLSAAWTVLGENVGVHGTGDVESLFQAFVNSPAHYRNLVDPRFHYVGVGVVHASNGKLWTTHRFMATSEDPPKTTAPITPPPTTAPPTTTAPTTEAPAIPPTTAAPTSKPATVPTSTPITPPPTKPPPSTAADPTTDTDPDDPGDEPGTPATQPQTAEPTTTAPPVDQAKPPSTNRSPDASWPSDAGWPTPDYGDGSGPFEPVEPPVKTEQERLEEELTTVEDVLLDLVLAGI